MPLRDLLSLRSLVRSLSTMSAESEPLSPELARKLEEYRKTSLNLLMAFLTVHSISASNALGAVTLGLLIYTISLHLATGAGALQHSSSVLSAFLHAVPLLGIFVMAAVELAAALRSPATVALVLLLCILPSLLAGARRAKYYIEKITEQLSVPMHEGPLGASANVVAP
ncbi:hypothetical protein F5I97DRAFT_1494535 [Phlebopus sp. FC_14]|nr:hypothetical protein F5I97DRAFT_1494535 [Phlebopus sp. FC_14]